ncbi:uncharacterized protein LOC107366995 [Tetranychus urticae]|uniref:uncharacterized protein LOC107366995 n=1 Tax=Tetranychus urticae TaxID=32264 RepID=UPI000D653446|nr:uncharacterized protein LOC107366995 [Tetranychus urticae]
METLSSDPDEALAELKRNINLSTYENFEEFHRRIKNLKYNSSPVITRWLFENLQNEKQRPSEDEYFHKYHEDAYRVYQSGRLLKVEEFKKLWNEVLSEKYTARNAAKEFVCLSENPSCQYKHKNSVAMKNHLFAKHLGITFECCCGQPITYYASYTAHYSFSRCKYKDSVKKLQSQSSECNEKNLDKIFVKYQNGAFRPYQSGLPITVDQFSKLWDEAQSDERVTKNGKNFVCSCENDACVANRYMTPSLPKTRIYVLTHHFKLSYECVCGKTFLSYGGYTGHYSTNRWMIYTLIYADQKAI